MLCGLIAGLGGEWQHTRWRKPDEVVLWREEEGKSNINGYNNFLEAALPACKSIELKKEQ